MTYPMRPETEELLAWAQEWLTEKGYHIQDKLPWRWLKTEIPTLIYAQTDDGFPVFGLLGHSLDMATLVRRMGFVMKTSPRPKGVFVFMPENAPHWVEFELKGKFQYDVAIVEAPPYPYKDEYYQVDDWESVFSIRLSKRDFHSPTS